MNPVLVDVNENSQPVSASSRQITTLIGVLARDRTRLPLDCFDWRKMEQQEKDLLWQDVKVCVHIALFLHSGAKIVIMSLTCHLWSIFMFFP